MSQDGYVDTFDDAAHGINEKRHDTGFFGGHREPVKGRKWDHARDGDPVIMRTGNLPTSSPWRTYIKASMYGPGAAEDGERKDEQFLQQQTPGYEKPWRGDLEANDDHDTFANLLHNRKRQRSLMKRFQVCIEACLWVRQLMVTASSSHASSDPINIPNHSAYDFNYRSGSIRICPPLF